MTNLWQILQDTAKEYEDAQILKEVCGKSMQRFEAILGELDADIARQQNYLDKRHVAAENDIAFVLLTKRRTNIAESLETLQERIPAIEESLRAATERLNDIKSLSSRARERAEG